MFDVTSLEIAINLRRSDFLCNKNERNMIIERTQEGKAIVARS